MLATGHQAVNPNVEFDLGQNLNDASITGAGGFVAGGAGSVFGSAATAVGRSNPLLIRLTGETGTRTRFIQGVIIGSSETIGLETSNSIGRITENSSGNENKQD